MNKLDVLIFNVNDIETDVMFNMLELVMFGMNDELIIILVFSCISVFILTQQTTSDVGSPPRQNQFKLCVHKGHQNR